MKPGAVAKRITNALREPVGKPPRLDSLDMSTMPPVMPVRIEPVVMTQAVAILEGEQDYVGQLERLTSKALNTIEKVLDYDGVPDPETLKMLQIKQTAASSVLQTQIKVDDNALRRRSIDLLPEILKVMKDQASRLPDAIRTIEHV